MRYLLSSSGPIINRRRRVSVPARSRGTLAKRTALFAVFSLMRGTAFGRLNLFDFFPRRAGSIKTPLRERTHARWHARTRTTGGEARVRVVFADVSARPETASERCPPFPVSYTTSGPAVFLPPRQHCVYAQSAVDQRRGGSPIVPLRLPGQIGLLNSVHRHCSEDSRVTATPSPTTGCESMIFQIFQSFGPVCVRFEN